MRKRFIAILVAITIAASVSGCAVGSGTSEDPRQSDNFSVSERYYKLSDGRTVFCLLVSSGVSCDWENAK